MRDLGITDDAFDELQQIIEAALPGRWDRASATDLDDIVLRASQELPAPRPMSWLLCAAWASRE